MIRYLLIACLLGVTSSAAAQLTGNDILRRCATMAGNAEPTSEEQAIEGIHCAGYVGGLHDMMALMDGVAFKGRLYCTPAVGLEIGQVILVFSSG